MRIRLALLLAAPGCYLSHPPDEREPAPGPDAGPTLCADGEAATAELCGDGLDQDCDGWDAPCPADVCATGVRRTEAATLSFADPGGCPWGAGDNETRQDGFFRARAEQVARVPLPPRSVLCGLQISAAREDLVFDDELIVAFADVVLVQSFDPGAPPAADDGLLRYRWEDLLYRPLPARPTTPYCLDAAGSCALPDSEERGRLALSLGGETGTALGELAIREGRAALTVVTTGDNNADTDCRHTPFDLDVTVEVVQP